MEEEPDQRVNRLRSQDAIATGADIIITACPYCLQMLQDGTGGMELEKPVEVLDLVQLLERVVALPAAPVKAEPVATSEVGAAAGDQQASAVGSEQGGQEVVEVESLES